ncbi:transmembrane channel-like protein [Ischnura elegans]|uniref:transmembrane channel-like protein n=1 Tax=Ischnura elegans TaxID=197161 RepID=UPI001ED8AA95|nr:transmembrane channel-like protein [Ischnura elegans]
MLTHFIPEDSSRAPSVIFRTLSFSLGGASIEGRDVVAIGALRGGRPGPLVREVQRGSAATLEGPAVPPQTPVCIFTGATEPKVVHLRRPTLAHSIPRRSTQHLPVALQPLTAPPSPPPPPAPFHSPGALSPAKFKGRGYRCEAKVGLRGWSGGIIPAKVDKGKDPEEGLVRWGREDGFLSCRRRRLFECFQGCCYAPPSPLSPIHLIFLGPNTLPRLPCTAYCSPGPPHGPYLFVQSHGNLRDRVLRSRLRLSSVFELDRLFSDTRIRYLVSSGVRAHGFKAFPRGGLHPGLWVFGFPPQTPSPQNFPPDYRPTVKFTVEGEPGGVEEEGGRRSSSPGDCRRSGPEVVGTRAKQIFMAQQPPPLPLSSTPPPYQMVSHSCTPPTSAPPDGRSLEAEGDEDDDDEEDYSASVSAILQQRRRASTRRSRRHRSTRRTSSPFSPLSPDGASLTARRDRRRSSVFTTSSGDTGYSLAVAEEGRGAEASDPVAEGVAGTASPSAIAAATQQQIFENLRLHKEVRESVKLQPWPMRRKVRLVQKAKAYVRRHEGELQERLAHGKSTRDLLARANLLIVKHWQRLRRELVNAAAFLIPWEQRIKEIESHFGSVVASYFTFLRWLFWVNLVIATLLIAFVITPEEFLVGREHEESDDRKQMLPEEKKTATNLLTLWDFEGALKYSPMFYGFYSNKEKTDGGYRIPFAYFMTGLAVYVYSFVATLRKMAENSRMSKLSEKDDECVFSWKLFTGWDYMIGNAETAHNRVASIILGFKEVLLEEREKQKDTRNWKVIALRVLVNFMVLLLLVSSAYAVVLVVQRSTKATVKDSWWRQNEITVVLSLISVAFPILFELIGFLESYHPRKQLRIQLARIMVLNLLNLYTLIFALFGKISNMTKELENLKPNITTTALPFMEKEALYPGIGYNITSMGINQSSNFAVLHKESSSNTLLDVSSAEDASLSLSISPQCFKDLVDCIIETTTVQYSTNVTSEKEIISLLVNVTTTLVPIFLKLVFQHELTTETTFVEGATPSTPIFSTVNNYSFDESMTTDSWTTELKRIKDAISSPLPKTSLDYDFNGTVTTHPTEEAQTTTYSTAFTSNVSDDEIFPTFDPLSSNDSDVNANITDAPTTNSTFIQIHNLTLEINETFNDTIYELGDIDGTSLPNSTDDYLNDLSTTSSYPADLTTTTYVSSVSEDVTSTVSESGATTTDVPISDTTFIPEITSILLSNDTEEATTTYNSRFTMDDLEDNSTIIPEENTEDYYVENWTSMLQDNDTLPSEEDVTVGPYSTETTKKPIVDSDNHARSNDFLLDDFYTEINRLTETITADYNLPRNSSPIDFSAFFNTSTESLFGSNGWTVSPSDLDIPIPLLKLDPTFAPEAMMSSTSQGHPDSDEEESTTGSRGSVNVEDLNVSGHIEHTLSQTESIDKELQKHVRALLVGHILTILLTAAVLVSKGEDSKVLTERLLKKDEGRILELISAWRDTVHGGNLTNTRGFSKGEQCFQALCTGSNINSTATADYNSSTSYNAVEKFVTSTQPTAVTTVCPVLVIPKRNVNCKLVNDSRLEMRKKLKRLCWETMFGQELVKLTVMDLVLTITSTFLVDFVRALFVRIMNHCWCWDLEKQFPQYGDFKIAENILHLVYNQGMVWMGMFFSPGLPALNLAKLAIVLYVRSWIVLTCNVPHDVVFRASRSNNFYLALLLTMLFLCALPVGYALVWVEPSWHCGPFAGRDRIASLFTSSVRAALPNQLRPVLDYVASPALVIPLLVLLVLVVAYLVSLAAALREANDDLRAQLRRERTEERRKMFRLANGRGAGRRGRRSRAGRVPSDDVSALGVPLEDFAESGEGAADGGPESKPLEAAPPVTGWRGLIGRLTNIRGSPGKTAKKEATADKPLAIGDASSLKESQDNEVNARAGAALEERAPAGDEKVSSSSRSGARIPSLAGAVAAALRRPKAEETEAMEMEEAATSKSSPPHPAPGDSPSSSACWSGDIPLIRIVRTADDANRRTPQQAQPQQPANSGAAPTTPPTPPAAYVNAALETDEEGPLPVADVPVHHTGSTADEEATPARAE